MESHEDQQFLETVVRVLVDHPESVQTTRTVDELGVLLTLDVHPEDMGKIIGRSGNTARAIRTLLKVVGMKHDARVNLKISEPAGSSRSNTEGDSTAGKSVNSVAASEDASRPDMSSTYVEQTTSPKSIDDAIDELRLT